MKAAKALVAALFAALSTLSALGLTGTADSRASPKRCRMHTAARTARPVLIRRGRRRRLAKVAGATPASATKA